MYLPIVIIYWQFVPLKLLKTWIDSHVKQNSQHFKGAGQAKAKGGQMPPWKKPWYIYIYIYIYGYVRFQCLLTYCIVVCDLRVLNENSHVVTDNVHGNQFNESLLLSRLLWIGRDWLKLLNSVIWESIIE